MELQAAIDGNRREARRSSYSFDYPMLMNTSASRSISPTGFISTHSSSSTMVGGNGGGPNSQTSVAMGNTATSGSPSMTPSSFANGALPLGMHNLSNALAPNPFGTAGVAGAGPNGGLPFGSHLNPMHPLLGLPSQPTGSINLPGIAQHTHTPSGLSSDSLVGSSMNLFPPGFFSPMVPPSSGFPLGAPAGFPSFGVGNAIEDIGSSMNSSSASSPPTAIHNSVTSSCLLPGIPGSFTETNAMAAAAAAATLFGASFPHLPGAFATSAPPMQHPPPPAGLSAIANQKMNESSSYGSISGTFSADQADGSPRQVSAKVTGFIMTLSSSFI